MALLDHHRQHLLDSAISEEVIASRGYASIENYYTWHQLRYGEAPNNRQVNANKIPFPSLSIPLYRPGQAEPAVYVARPDSPRIDFNGRKVKYEYPRGVGNILDILPIYHKLTTDTNKAVWLTEGAKKADSLATIYGDTILPINENGVWGWRSKGKVVDDINKIVWEGRTIVLAPDGDVRHNDNVHRAVKRTSRLLIAHGARQVLILLLPCEPGQTTGVDDYIAAGHTMSELESHLVTLESVSSVAKVPLMNHPETGAKLFLPPDYDVQGKTLVKRGRGAFYSGIMAITSLGKDIHTGDEVATVQWNGKGQHGELVLPRQELASTEGCRRLASRGAAVHARNAGELSCYLTEFAQENYESLPYRSYTDRYGITPYLALVSPGGVIQANEELIYNGDSIAIGTDRNAYASVMQEIETWNNSRVIWLLLALSLASPSITRLGLDRNPSIYLGGASGAGKTTSLHFALGVWGDPRPFTIQCGSGSSTKVGMNQAMTRARGMPLFFEDVHVMLSDKQDAKKIMGNIYDFANKQGRFIGSLDGKGRGGDSIGGCLFLAGEMLPEFTWAGQQRRLFTIDCGKHLPLGAMPRSLDGAERADILKEAAGGYGLFGPQVAAAIWDQWELFLARYHTLVVDPALNQCHEWANILAAAGATLEFALEIADIAQDYEFINVLLRDWAKIHKESQKATTPAEEYFNRIIMMLAQSDVQMEVGGLWQIAQYERKMVAARKLGDAHWRVMTRSPQFEDFVGKGAVTQFGQDWLSRGYVLPHANGAVSEAARCFTTRTSCIFVPNDLIFLGDVESG